MEPHDSNPKGFFESVQVRDFNDTLLAAAGSSWKDWRPIAPHWFSSAKAQALHAAADRVIEEEFGTAKLFVLKDPRICRLLPFWRHVLEKRGVDIVALHTHRPPQEVAGSLKARYNFNPGFTHLLWLRHLLDAECASRGLVRHFTSYAQLLDDPTAVIAQIAERLDLPLPDEKTAQEMRGFLSPELRNHYIPAQMQEDGLAPWYRESLALFEQAAQAGQGNIRQARLDAIRTEFDRAAPVFAPVFTQGRAG
jgi:hypothetical protein